MSQSASGYSGSIGVGVVLDGSLSIPAEDCAAGSLVVQPAPTGLEGDVASYRSLRTTIATIATDTRTTVNDTAVFWTGTDSEGFRQSGRQRAAEINSIVAPLDKIIGAYETLIDALMVLQEQASTTLDTGDGVVGIEPCNTSRGTWASSANDVATYQKVQNLVLVHRCSFCDNGLDMSLDGSCTDSWRARDAVIESAVKGVNDARQKLTDYRADAVLARQAFQTTAEAALADLGLPVSGDWGNPEIGPPLDVIPETPVPAPGTPEPGIPGPGNGGGGGGNGGGGGGGRGGVPQAPLPELADLPELPELAVTDGAATDGTATDGAATDAAALDGANGLATDGSTLAPVPPPDLRWVEDQIAAREIVDGRWSVTDDPGWTEYMLSDPALSARVDEGSLGAANEAVQRYLQTGASDGTFTTLPADIAGGAAGPGAVEPAPTSTSPAFGDRLGALPPPAVDGSSVVVRPGELDHSGSSSVVPLGDGRFAVTVEVDHVWTDRVELSETFPPGSWQDGASEVLTRGVVEPYDLSVKWGETRTVVLDAQGHVYAGALPEAASRA